MRMNLTAKPPLRRLVRAAAFAAFVVGLFVVVAAHGPAGAAAEPNTEPNAKSTNKSNAGADSKPSAELTSPSFSRDIQPILSNHCFACHGPDEEHNDSGIRLDVPDSVDLDSVLDRIASDDADWVMPPPEMHKPLGRDQIEALRRWIAAGAPYETHWSFERPQAFHPETGRAIGDGSNGFESKVALRPEMIDAWIDDGIERSGLEKTEPADRYTLIRRMSLVLVGLPPTQTQIETYVNDDRPGATERLIDRLIAHPAYGEHMGRYWLDLVRFADTNGLHHDHYREMTPYRDWVISAMNNNLPFDEFIIDQVAGDLRDEPNREQLIASGFNRLHLVIDRGTAVPEESMHRNVVDRVSTFGTAMLGLTVGCAACHDHKYDPISQEDFYSLYAFFNNIDAEPETGHRGTSDFNRGLHPPYLELPTSNQRQRLNDLENQIASLRSIETDGKTDAKTDAKNQSRLDALKRQLDQLRQTIPATLISRERADVRSAHIMDRGQYDQPGRPVTRRTPTFLPPLRSDANGSSADDLATRMDLARWLVREDQPLTARVTVNRVWQQFFGTGLVQTSEDFGAQGSRPSHPELLDYLAVGFRQSGWDLKQLCRSIARTEAFQRSARSTPQAYRTDPTNRWLARGPRYRLDAEVIRDSIYASCGLISTQLFGASVKPPQPDGLWQTVTMPSSFPKMYRHDTGESAYRRSLYSFWKRALPPPQLAIFNAPTREVCSARRERTNTPLQALVLMNEPDYFAACVAFARRLMSVPASRDQRLCEIHQAVLSQKPDDVKLRWMNASMDRLIEHYRANGDEAKALVNENQDRFQSVAATAIESAWTGQAASSAELAAWTMMIHALINSDEMRTLP